MDNMKINLNQTVKVRITEFGKQILIDQHKALEAACGKKIPSPKYDVGEHKMQLWAVMQSFGPYMNMGSLLPIDTIIEVI